MSARGTGTRVEAGREPDRELVARANLFDLAPAGGPEEEGRYAARYDELAAALCDRLRAAAAPLPGWREGVREALASALSFLAEDAARARLLALAPSGPGRPPRARHERIVGALAELLDAGREEPAAPPALSRVSAEIAAGAVCHAIERWARGGCAESPERLLPELSYLATMPYLGERAAQRELPLRALP